MEYNGDYVAQLVSNAYQFIDSNEIMWDLVRIKWDKIFMEWCPGPATQQLVNQTVAKHRRKCDALTTHINTSHLLNLFWVIEGNILPALGYGVTANNIIRLLHALACHR